MSGTQKFILILITIVTIIGLLITALMFGSNTGFFSPSYTPSGLGWLGSDSWAILTDRNNFLMFLFIGGTLFAGVVTKNKGARKLLHGAVILAVVAFILSPERVTKMTTALGHAVDIGISFVDAIETPADCSEIAIDLLPGKSNTFLRDARCSFALQRPKVGPAMQVIFQGSVGQRQYGWPAGNNPAPAYPGVVDEVKVENRGSVPVRYWIIGDI